MQDIQKLNVLKIRILQNLKNRKTYSTTSNFSESDFNMALKFENCLQHKLTWKFK